MDAFAHAQPVRRGTPDGLVIGTLNLSERDTKVLRILVGLLATSMGTGLRMDDDPRRARVVFSGHPIHGGAGRVVIVVGLPQTRLPMPTPHLWLASPLSLGTVSHALQAAMAQLGAGGHPDRAMWLVSLFDRMCEALNAGGCSAMPVGGAGLLLVDAGARRMQASLPLGQLLAQPCRLGPWRPATAVDRELLRSAERQSLRAFMWRLSGERVHASVAPGPPAGPWQLLHWPSSAGLLMPGHPQLAAWLSRRPASVAELVERTGLAPETVNAFVCTGLALGLIGPVAAAAGPAAGPVARTGTTPGWMAGLRERLMLW